MVASICAKVFEDLAATVKFVDFKAKWEASETRTDQLKSQMLSICGWKLQVCLSGTDEKVALFVRSYSDNGCILCIEELKLKCGDMRPRGFDGRHVIMPNWVGPSKIQWCRRLCTALGRAAFSNLQDLLAIAETEAGTLAVQITIRAARLPSSIDPPNCLKLPPAALLEVFSNADFIQIIGENNCEVKVPQGLLCAHSTVIAAALGSGMEETSTRVITMPDAKKQSIEDFRDCVVSGGLPSCILTGWQRILEVLLLASKYAIAPLADSCTFYLSMAITATIAPKLLLVSDKYGLSKLRKAVINVAISSDQSYDSVITSDEYASFSGDLLRELSAYEVVRKKQDWSEVEMPLDGQWGDTPHEFPDNANWQTLPTHALRRACFERLLGTAGTAAELVARLSAPAVEDNSEGSEPDTKRQRTST